MTAQELCLDPEHITHPVTVKPDDVPRCETCGGERLAFHPEPDPRPGTLWALPPDETASPPTVCWMAHTYDLSACAVFDNELDALRHAVGNSMHVIELRAGDVMDQINAKLMGNR